MKAFRRLGFALWLVFALVAGQQAAALHALGHASERLSQKQDPKPVTTKCADCFVCAQLSAGAAATVPAVALSAAAFTPHVFAPHGERNVTALAYRSRAPPTLL
jgi:hypothetical protein